MLLLSRIQTSSDALLERLADFYSDFAGRVYKRRLRQVTLNSDRKLYQNGSVILLKYALVVIFLKVRRCF